MPNVKVTIIFHADGKDHEDLAKTLLQNVFLMLPEFLTEEHIENSLRIMSLRLTQYSHKIGEK